MAGYVIAQVDITDPVRYQEYTKGVPATIAEFGGEFLVRGGEFECVEGTWPERRMVVLRFESVARARQWYDSAEYAGLKAIRQSASAADLIIVEGV